MSRLPALLILALLGAAPPQDAKPPVSVKGTVALKGKAPARKRIRLDAVPKCAALHPEPMLSEDVLVDAENRLQWAFVHVKSGLAAGVARPAAPKAPVVLDQR
ncbi:MAG TPA: hypothetical protein VJB14_03830, partial [Planctomycetota bacterium]|nr:hypothetical protein [Planctomycetota bacterium]